MAVSCPSCNHTVSPKAFDCPHCGHPLRKPRRGPFGVFMKWLLILFNLAMLAWLIFYLGIVGEMASQQTGEVERAGTALGGTIGVGVLMTFWVLGDIILGLVVILTRPTK